MKNILFKVLLILSILNHDVEAQNIKGSFELGHKEFILNGKPFTIRAAELHYPRIPKEYWEHRIQLSKAMGMNTICIYLFWNLHEQRPDKFDFSGQNDVAEFVRLIQKNGMYCIVRPGPYVCAEWDMGGLPWWLLKKSDLKVRTVSDSFFMDRTKKFFNHAGRQLAPLQIQNGGNIIMVQVENEYGTFGSDKVYMERIRDGIIEAGFDKVQLFRCDWSSNFNKYRLDDVATTLNFGAGANIDEQFRSFNEVYPSSPLMCSEYWTGWFDHWGKPHETRSINSFIGSLKDMMDRRISFSLYMAHGGTSFGQWGGANSPLYSPMATSYDYNAPIGEQGNTTDKFYAIRNLLKNYLLEGETLAEIPPPKQVIKIPPFEMKEYAPLLQNLPSAKYSEIIKPMEYFDQGWGRILYRTNIPASSGKRMLTITELHDWAIIFLNGNLVAKLDRRRGDNSVELPGKFPGGQLDILVEATGRVNYGNGIIDRKGITEKVELSDGTTKSELRNWSIFNFPVDYSFQKKAKFRKKIKSEPGWYRGVFSLSNTGDTFLDVSTWGKGMVWINGHNIGRFWKIGPQQTLYIPGVWLKKGMNEIIILDVDLPSKTVVAGLSKPILDKINPDESLLHRTKEQTLDLSTESPVVSGSFTHEKGWKEVNFTEMEKGQYFCIEALSSQVEGDSLTTIAELELIGEDSKPVSTVKWRVLYADSEEIVAANHAADRVFDQQESTFWQSRFIGLKPPHPHQIVIDLGEMEIIKGFRYLPRLDKEMEGMIKEYKIYLKETPFKF